MTVDELIKELQRLQNESGVGSYQIQMEQVRVISGGRGIQDTLVSASSYAKSVVVDRTNAVVSILNAE